MRDGMLDEVFRAEWARVLAALVGFCGDVGLAEDAAQDAFVTAARSWDRDGPPEHPRAWLVATGRNRVVDRLRRDRALAAKLPLLEGPAASDPVHDDRSVPDERLELIFLCCHPALPQHARVALTLRAVGGLSTSEIARAFLVATPTMKRRLTRARIALRDTAFRVPEPDELPERLAAVLAVLYLVFNQGWGDGRVDLATEAVRLTRVLHALLPDRAEATALLALMLLHDSRRAARVDDDAIVPLAEQDRARWDHGRIAEGRDLLDEALAASASGPYAVQAAIAELQTEDPIDWDGVLALYDRLLEQTGSAVVALNRAVAVAHARDPVTALALVDTLRLDGYRYFHSTRAELLRRIGDAPAARAAYDRALGLVTTGPERRFLERRRAELDGPSAGP